MAPNIREKKIVECAKNLKLSKKLPKVPAKRMESSIKLLNERATDATAPYQRVLFKLIEHCGPTGFYLCVAALNQKEILSKNLESIFELIKSYEGDSTLCLIAKEYNIPESVDGKYSTDTSLPLH
jgi:hypothetical protein